MNRSNSVKRKTYRSPLRQAQAKATRLRVIEAATRLFAEGGYGATSIDQIAATAGVGRATVFTAVGGKPVLLRAAYDVALVGDDEPLPLPQRAWARPVRLATTQADRINRYAEVITLVGSRVAAIYEAFGGAASTDPAVRESWDDIRAERRTGARNFVRLVIDLGPLREGLDETSASDIVWILNDPRLYHQLILQQGWATAKFCAWIAETMQGQLLGRPSEPTQ